MEVPTVTGRSSQEQTLLEKTLWIISSIVKMEQVQSALVWINLYKKRLQTLYGKKDVDVPQQVYQRLDNKIREYENPSRSITSKAGKTDHTRISNNLRIREKIENWEKRKKVARQNNS